MTRVRSLLGSAMSRATSGLMPKAAIAVAVVTTFAGLVLGVAAGRQGEEPLRVAPLAAQLLAWGAGVLLCFAASIRAFDRDRDEGWTALVARHGARETSYLVARIGGLALATAIVVVPGTVVTGLATALAARDAHVAREALVGTVAATAYAIGFSIIVAPIALAALGARNRASGYLWLLTLLVLPALLAEYTGPLFPEGWGGLVSVPGILDELRESMQGAFDPVRGLRAIVVLALVTILASAWARAQLSVHRSEP
ncbi:MAG TPA: hypothetical protein VGH28_22410 [Polyangiaceae bacterium]